jgi:alpha-tubulin suppressor-like RCC1 family protein
MVDPIKVPQFYDIN